MAKKISGRDLEQHGADRYKRSSELFKYVMKNMAGLRRQGYGTRDGPAWAKLLAQAEKHGLTMANGSPLTIEAVRKVFARASRTALAEELAVLGTERLGRVGGSRQPLPARGWTPTAVVAAPRDQAAIQPSPFAPPPTSPARADPSQMTPAERKADLMRVIDKRSGR